VSDGSRLREQERKAPGSPLAARIAKVPLKSRKLVGALPAPLRHPSQVVIDAAGFCLFLRPLLLPPDDGDHMVPYVIV